MEVSKIFKLLMGFFLIITTLFVFEGKICAQGLSGDANGDGKVDGVDYVVWLNNYGTSSSGASKGDFNNDGKVDGVDYVIWLNNYGTVATPTPTSVSTPTPVTATPTPGVQSSEWSQLAHDAQHTGYAPTLPSTPWSFAWQWNGSNSSGGVASGHIQVPKMVQPVTGAGKVYVPYGSGIVALNQASGAEVWNVSPGGSLNATAAYDSDTNCVFVGSNNGNLYKLNSGNGSVSGNFSSGSNIKTAPLLASGYVYVSAGNSVYKINKSNMQQVWRYDAGAFIQQTPAYSPSRDILVVGSSDGSPDGTGYENLNVIAINNSNGSLKWRVDPNPALRYQPADSFHPPEEYIDAIEWENGWPVIAEQHGLVLMQLRNLWYYEIDGGFRYPTNDQYRTALTNHPEYRKLYALDLDDGSQPFLTVVQNSGFNNSRYSPMGPQPVVKVWPNGDEVAYTTTYNSTTYNFYTDKYSCPDQTDRQCGASFAELILDTNKTISCSDYPGYCNAGDVRLIQGEEGTASLQTDEHGYMSMAGNMFFYDHWAFASGHRITDRSVKYGMPYLNAIKTGNNGQPEQVFLTENNYRSCGSCCGSFNSSHYCSTTVGFESGGRSFDGGGFYVYYGTSSVYNRYWTEGVFVTISGNNVFFRSNDGAILAVKPSGS